MRNTDPDLPDFPAGLHLLGSWQAGDDGARDRLGKILEAGIDGAFDNVFKIPAPSDAVHASGSIDLLSLGMVFDLFGITAAEFYKGNPQRYVRCVMTTMKLLGMNKLYLSWPVYALTAEALGQPMIYSDGFSPGTDPGNVLVDSNNWHDLPPLDLSSGIPAILSETVEYYRQVTGNEPVLHLAAPYSLAADIFGQEHLISALISDPQFVQRFVDHLADTVHQPWIDQFFCEYPNGWVELSDASGSPFFIGPQNCMDVAIGSIRRLTDRNPWGHRVYDANYRGDYVTKAAKPTGSASRRRGRGTGRRSSSVSLAALSAAKHSVCRDYVIRLADDRVESSHYVANAIEHNVPLFMGIGASDIDRHSITDPDDARQQITSLADRHVQAIKTVATSIADGGYALRTPPWPGTVYFEDVSAESSFDLIEAIIGTTLTEGKL